MNPSFVAALAALCVFAAGLVGLYGHPFLPAAHRSKESQETVRLGIGMLSVLSSLVLGLLIASAKGSWDSTDRALRSYAAELILLDETLRDYGRDAAEPRRLLRDYALRMMHDIWPPDGRAAPTISDRQTGLMLEHLRERIRALQPRDAPAQWLLDQALLSHISLLRQRWQLIEQQGPAVRPVVLVILVSWIVAIFASFGLNAPRNATVVAAFLVCSLGLGASVFLILELDSPFTGVLSISQEPMLTAVQHMQEPQ